MPRFPVSMSRQLAFPLLAAAIVLAGVGVNAAHADWTAVTADLSEQPHLTINTWNAREGLSATSQVGKLTQLATRDIVTLSSSKLSGNPGGGASAAAISSGLWKIQLRNGDVVLGTAAGLSGQSLLIKTTELGTLPVPLKALAGMASGKAEPASAASDKDLVRLANGDRLEGIVATIDETKLQLATDAGGDTPMDVPLANVASIAFGGAKAPRTAPPLSIRLTFASGTVLTFPIDSFSWTLQKIALKDSVGQEHTVGDDQVLSAEILGGRVLYLSELDPAAEQQVTFIGTTWPMQINRNVMGDPLRVGKTTYGRGLGVHTQSTLAYDLDGSYDTLSFRVGLDDSAAPQGQATASVVVDGKTLWRSKTLKPGEVTPEISVPVAGGKRLELHADPAGHLDVQGRVDWLNVALKRR